MTDGCGTINRRTVLVGPLAGFAWAAVPLPLRAANDGPPRVDLRVQIRHGNRRILQTTVRLTLGRRAEIGGGDGAKAHRLAMLVYASKKHAGAYMVLLEHTLRGREIGEPAFLVSAHQPATLALSPGPGRRELYYDIQVQPARP